METQKISRTDLKIIYDQVCPDWQKKIGTLALNQGGDTIVVEPTMIKEAFSQANETQKQMLKKYFKYSTGNVLDEIETFEDILRIAKEKYGRSFVSVSRGYADLSSEEVDRINTDRQLELIALVLNGDWIADFKNPNQRKWTPWFERTSSGWVLASGGVYYDYVSGAGVGPYFKDETTALFAGKKFLDLFKKKLPA